MDMKRKRILIIGLLLLLLFCFINILIYVASKIELKEVEIIENCDYKDEKNIKKIGIIKTSSGERNVYSVCLNKINLSRVKKLDGSISLRRFIMGTEFFVDVGIGQIEVYRGKNYYIMDCNYFTILNMCTEKDPCNPVVISGVGFEHELCYLDKKYNK